MNDILLTNNLVKRLRQIQAERGDPGLMLRLAVDGGGCQGFEYRFSFVNGSTDGDGAFDKDGVTLLVDEVSLPLLAGSTIDFIDDLAGASFKVLNPNAVSTCGCGTSFAA